MLPIRVLVVSHCMDRNGAESLIMNIYRNLDRNKVQFDFLLHCNYRSAFEDEIESIGGRIFKISPYKIYNHFAYVKTLERFFSNHPEYRIVHGHLFNRIAYLKVAKKLGLITIAHCHASTNGNGISAKIADYLHRNINRYSDYRFACSRQAGEWLYGEKASFTVIPNAIDTSIFKFNSEKRKLVRTDLGISECSMVIGHIGRFIQVKNHEFILRVFAAYKKIVPDSSLLLVGDGPLLNTVKEKTGILGLSDSVITTGARQDIPDLLCAMDCFIFPSLFEGLPVTLIEAQCSGLPCVIADHITDEAAVTDLFTRLSLSQNPESWAYKIAKNENKREPYSTVVMNAGYDIKKTSAELQAFYLKLAKEAGQSK